MEYPLEIARPRGGVARRLVALALGVVFTVAPEVSDAASTDARARRGLTDLYQPAGIERVGAPDPAQASPHPASEVAPSDPAEPSPDPASPEPGGSAETSSPELDETGQPFLEQPPTPEPRRQARRPGRRRARVLEPIYGPLLLSFGVTAGRGVGVSAGVTGFPIPYVGFGVELTDIVWFDDDGAFNDLIMAPHVVVIPLPRLVATPYLRGALGGEFFNRPGLAQAYGHWQAGGGVLFRLGADARFVMKLGVTVIGRMPDARFDRYFSCAITSEPCSLGVLPEIGLAYRIGSR